jgi:hypothetical protein
MDSLVISIFFIYDSITPSEPVPLRFLCSVITLRHAIVGRTRHRGIYLAEITPCPRRNSNPQSQKASSRRPTPQTARPLISTRVCLASPNADNSTLLLPAGQTQTQYLTRVT